MFCEKKLAPHLIRGGTGWREEDVSRLKYGEILQSGTQIACTEFEQFMPKHAHNLELPVRATSDSLGFIPDLPLP
jgi:anti-sigma regulatory factor (Ser/Thr protein kinase)